MAVSATGWLDTTTSRLLVGTIALVFVLSFVLRITADLFLFGGSGFGTVYAQTLFWVCWRLIARVKSSNAPSISAVSFCVALLSGTLYAAVALAVAAALRRRATAARLTLVALLGVYLIVLFIFPQARFGP